MFKGIPGYPIVLFFSLDGLSMPESPNVIMEFRGVFTIEWTATTGMPSLLASSKSG